MSVKKFWKSVKKWQSYGHEFGVSLFLEHGVECWQLTCQFPTCRSPVLCSFDHDNSMYEQQTWMLTLGLLNRNTGCQCCSVRCSSMLKLLCISIHSSDLQKFSNGQNGQPSSGWNCSTVPNFVEIALTEAEIWWFIEFSRWRTPPCWIFKISNS